MSLQVLPAKQAALWIIDALEGPARKLVLAESHHAVDTPQKVLDILKGEWGDRKSLTMRRKAFYGKSQGTVESITEYATALHQFWSRCNKGVPVVERLSDDNLINIFIDNLRTVALRRELRKVVQTKVQNGQVATFKELVLIARDWMKEEEEVSSAKAAKILVDVPEVQIDFARDRSKDPNPAKYLDELEEMRKKLEECTSEIIKLRNEGLPSKEPGSTKQFRERNNRFQFGNREIDPPRCWQCGSEQHFRAQCPGLSERKSRRIDKGLAMYCTNMDRMIQAHWLQICGCSRGEINVGDNWKVWMTKQE